MDAQGKYVQLNHSIQDRKLGARHQRALLDPSHVLPPELFFDILGYLEATSLVKASAVSWQWRALCVSPYLWKVLYLRAGWKVADQLSSRFPDRALCVRQSGQITLDRIPQDADVPWHFLFRQRTRLKNNWDAGRFVRFRLPHPDYAAEGHVGTVYAIQECGRQLVSGGADGTVRRWDLDSQRLIGRALRGHHGRVYALHFDGCKDIIISGSSSAEVFVWRFSSGELLQTIPRAHDNAIVSLHLSGDVLASGSMNNEVKIWKKCSSRQADNASADPGHYDKLTQTSILEGHVGGVTAVYIHENNVVSSSGDLLVKVWSIDTGECLRTFSNSEHVAGVHVNGPKLSKGVPHPIQIIDHTSGETIATLCKTSQTLRTAYAKLDKGRCVALVSGSLEEHVTIWTEAQVKTWSPLRHLPLCDDVETVGDTSSNGQALDGTFSAQGQEQAQLQQQQQQHRRNAAEVVGGNTPNDVSRSATSISGLVSGPIRKPRIYHVQVDERRITCCSIRFGIVGWDFGNGDRDIQLASRFFPD